MSIATLKKKTAAKYNNLSVDVPQFSVVGGYRNQGWVGQTSLSRSLPRSLRRGDTLRGNGGCCGTYTIANPVQNPDLCSKNNNQVIKKASMNTRGMLMSKYRWIRRPVPYTSVKPGSGNILYRSEGDYIERKSKTALCCNNFFIPMKQTPCGSCNVVPNMFKNQLNTPQSFASPYTNTVTKDNQQMYLPVSESDYLNKKIACCTELDKEFLDQENQKPYCRTNNTCNSLVTSSPTPTPTPSPTPSRPSQPFVMITYNSEDNLTGIPPPSPGSVWYQSFTSTLNGKFTKFQFYKDGYQPGEELTVRILEGEGIGGNVLHTGTWKLPLDNTGWVGYDIGGGGVPLILNQKYSIQLTTSNNNTAGFLGTDPGGYTGGYFFWDGYGGEYGDLWFKIWVTT